MGCFRALECANSHIDSFLTDLVFLGSLKSGCDSFRTDVFPRGFFQANRL
jgi:hypothetical protein